MLLNCDDGEDSSESLGQQGDQTVSTKEDQPWIFTGRTNAEAEAPVPWLPHVKSWLIGKDPDAGKDWGQEKGATKDKMVGYWVTDSIGVSLSKLWELVKDREAWHDAVYGVAKNWTRLSDWITVSINSNIGTCRSVFVASFFPSFLGHLTFWWGAVKKTKQNNDLLRKLVWRKLGN